jgi:hypothetical protein
MMNWQGSEWRRSWRLVTTRLNGMLRTATQTWTVRNAIQTPKSGANLIGTWMVIITTYCLVLWSPASSAVQCDSKWLFGQSRWTLLNERLLLHYHRGLFSRQRLLPYPFESVYHPANKKSTTEINASWKENIKPWRRKLTWITFKDPVRTAQ